VAGTPHAVSTGNHFCPGQGIDHEHVSAYNGRCALSGLPESLLLDAAHIVADKDFDRAFGQQGGVHVVLRH
jgi:hypothetical protein